MIHEKPELRFMVMTESYPSLKQILQNIEQVVWIIDVSTGQIQYVNPAFEVVWGRSRNALYTDSLILIKSVHPEDRVK
jgi:PAS domain-containing protein